MLKCLFIIYAAIRLSQKQTIMTEEQKLTRTLKIMEALDSWGLSGEQILVLLDFPSSGKSRHLQQYRKDTSFPDNEQIENRVIRLLGIIDALRTSFPRNFQMGAQWMQKSHRRMKNRAPLVTMLEDGESGVIAVLSELDCTYAWELSGSRRV